MGHFLALFNKAGFSKTSVSKVNQWESNAHIFTGAEEFSRKEKSGLLTLLWRFSVIGSSLEE